VSFTAWGVVAGLVGLVLASIIWLARREGVASAKLQNEVDHARTDKAAADVMAERRDPDDASERLRRGDF
jgi:hypothetical protein